MPQNQLTIVVALIRNEKNEVLLAQRNEPATPQVHNMWEFPGGKIEFGEDPETAVIREAREETGLEIKIKRLLPKIYTHVWDNTENVYQVIILAYECKVVGLTITSNDPKIKALKYFKLPEINYDDCLPRMKEIIDLLKAN